MVEKTADGFVEFIERIYETKLLHWQKELAKAVFNSGNEGSLLIPLGCGYSQTLAYMELLRLIFLVEDQDD